MNLWLMLSLLTASIFVIGLFLILKIQHLQKENRSAKNMLDQQIRLTDAYAWEVESKRYELIEALMELKKAHENSVRTNQNLEEEVSKRTSALLAQNQKILEYHFINAHTLRAPVARILGLVSLLQNSSPLDNNSLIIRHLTSTTQELDDTVHAIQQTLYAAEYTDRLQSA